MKMPVLIDSVRLRVIPHGNVWFI